MENEETMAEIGRQFQEMIGSDRLPGPDENLIDYGFDSLDTVEGVMLVEEHFGVELDDEDLDHADTIRKIAALVDARKAPVA